MQYSVTILWATFWAISGAMAGRWLALPGAAVVCVSALVISRHFGLGPWLLLWPAALGAAIPANTNARPPAGPVRFAATVLPGTTFDQSRHETWLRLQLADGSRLDGHVLGRLQVLAGDRITGVGRIADAERPRLWANADAIKVRPGRPSVWRFAETCRAHMTATILQNVHGDAGPLLCQLVLGSGPKPSAAIADHHRATGLTHLLAVSGAHATMLAFLLGLLFQLASGRAPLGHRGYRRVTAVILTLYGFLTGLEAPVFRALIASFVFLLCAGAHRRPAIATALVVPAMLTALLLPHDLFSVSFSLSYAAVFGLMLSGAASPKATTTVRRWLLRPLLASVFATITTMPITLWVFGQCAPWTIVATPLLSPVVALLLALGLLLGTLGAGLPFLAPILGATCGGLADLYIHAVALFAQLPGAPIYASTRPDPWLLAALGLGATGFWLATRHVTGIIALCLSVSLPHFFVATGCDDASVEVLAVGHGQACLVALPDHRIVLIDCGSLGQRGRAAQRVQRALLPRRRIDLLVVTHGDADHAGGLPDLLQRLPVTRALLPEHTRDSAIHKTLTSRGCTVTFVGPGQRLGDGPHLTIAAPAVPPDSQRNDLSLWVRADLGPFRFLCPGDAETSGTRAYLDSSPPRSEVLLLPHHGRPHALIDALLRAVRPRLAIASAARRDGETAQTSTVRQHGIEVLHTGLAGNIRIRASNPPRIETQRRDL